MDAKAKILGRIRKGQGREAAVSNETADILSARIKSHARGIIPKRGQIPLKDQIALFQKKIEALGATVAHVEKAEDVPTAVQRYLADNNMPSRVKITPSKEVTDLPWGEIPTLEMVEGAGKEEDMVGLSPAFAAIAESGTLMMASGADTPSTVNFVPENHIVVLKSSRMRGSYEETWDMLREKFGESVMPRSVNFISGPSRTADIEQRLIMGAHGPKELHIIMVNDDA